MHTIQNGATTIRVEISEFKGRTGLSIRKCFVSKETGELVYSRKGIFIPMAVAEAVVEAAQNELERNKR